MNYDYTCIIIDYGFNKKFMRFKILAKKSYEWLESDSHELRFLKYI